MSPHRRWALAARLEASVPGAIRLGPHSALEFYTLGAAQWPILEVEGPIRAMEARLRSWGFQRAGYRWAGPDVVEPSASNGGKALATRIGAHSFHVPPLEETIVDALEEAVRSRHPDAWRRLVVAWAAHGERINIPRLHESASVRGVGEALQSLRRRSVA